jgi:hypothetical protein
MPLGIAITDGTRKLSVIGRVVVGAAPSFTSLSFRPVLKPYTSQAILRILDNAGNVFDCELEWTALPKFETDVPGIESVP